MLAALAPLAGAAISAGTSIYAGNQNAKHQSSLRAQELAHQKEFAQNGIQWKVADAKAAGVHPLFALGASTHSYSPMAIGNSPVAEAMASAGQDIGRAVSATASQSGRMSSAMAALGLERAKLENDLLKTQIMKTVQPTNPPMPSPATRYLIDGQGDTSAPPGTFIVDKPLERTTVDPVNRHSEPGALPDVGFLRTADGSYMPVPSDNAKQRIEDNRLHEIMHFLRNNIAPVAHSGSYFKPPFAPDKGKTWQFSPISGYYQVPIPKPRGDWKYLGYDYWKGR